MKDYYFILGVAPDASNNEIKEAFRKLCLKYHPDRTVTNAHNQERYMDICEAYRTLSNKVKRRTYDRHREKWLKDREPINTGILPEIKTTYKGHYPWLAAFAILIVAALSVLFLYNTDKHLYTDNSIISPPPTPRTLAIADEIHERDSAQNASPTIDSSVMIEPVIDSATYRKQQFITSILSQHTVTPDRRKFPTMERNYRYSFSGEQLYVTYEKPQAEGHPLRKKVTIPVKGIKSVYCYAGQLWITGRSIKVYDLKSGKRENTDFFSVRFNNGAGSGVDQELANAFAQLKPM